MLIPKSHRNATYCVDFNIVIRILNTPVPVKTAQDHRKGMRLVLFHDYWLSILLHLGQRWHY